MYRYLAIQLKQSHFVIEAELHAHLQKLKILHDRKHLLMKLFDLEKERLGKGWCFKKYAEKKQVEF